MPATFKADAGGAYLDLGVIKGTIGGGWITSGGGRSAGKRVP
jgi:hypothetical protein